MNWIFVWTKKDWLVGLRWREWHEVGGNSLKYLKIEWNIKKGRETKILKIGASWFRGGCLQTESWNPLTNYEHNIRDKEKAISHWIWCFFLCFIFFITTVPDNRCDKQKWYVLSFTCIKIVVHVLAWARAIAHIKLKKLPKTPTERNALICFNEKVQINNTQMETFSFYSPLPACPYFSNCDQ